MGIVFTTLFAVGLLLIRQAADNVDIDPDCVLHGSIEFTPLDTVAIGNLFIPRAAIVNGSVLLLNLAIIIALFKELKLSAFDSELADTLGYSSRFLHYLLMTMVAVTTVAAFESVGSIIVIAMLIVPPATALLLTHRMIPMLVIASATAALSAIIGHLSAIVVPTWFGQTSSTSTSGMIAFATGLLFAIAWLFSPLEGIVTKRVRRFCDLQGPELPTN